MSTNKTVSPYHWPNRACLKSLDRLIAGAKVKNIIGSLDAYAKLEHELKVHFKILPFSLEINSNFIS